VRPWATPAGRRWIAFGALAGVYGFMAVFRLSTAVLAEELTAAFGTTAVALGTLHASFFYVYALAQLPGGVLTDRAGSRLTVTAGGAAMGLGGVAFALSGTYAEAFAARTLIGLGGSVLFIAILRFLALWYRPDAFATMSGITIAVSGFGGILATTPLAVVVAATSWRSAILGAGALTLALSVVAYALSRDTPEAAGLGPVDGSPAPAVQSLRAVVANVRVVLRERETWLVGVVLFSGTGVNLTVLGLWGVPYLVQTYGLSVTRASLFTLVGSAGSIVGPPLVGRLSDAVERRTALMVLGTGVFALAYAVLAVGQPPLVVVALVFFASGFLIGTFALGYTVVKERHGARSSGVATGTVNSIAFLGASLLPTVMGVALDSYWTGETVGGARVYTLAGYRVAFGVAALAGLVAVASALWLHVRTERR